MNEKFPFFNELILPLEIDGKGTNEKQENDGDGTFCLLSSEPRAQWSVENHNMLSKIVSLCGYELEHIQVIDIKSAIEINHVINQPNVETLLCFADQKIWNELHYKPGKQGFMKLNHKNVIFLPELTAFSANPKAKKYLWQAIQNTLQK